MPSLSRIRVVSSVLVLLGLLFVGARGAGPLPALGPLLDPVSGVWAVAEGARLPESPTSSPPLRRTPLGSWVG